MAEGKAIYAGLLAVQQGLKAPKDKSGGKYKYRSAEDVLEKVKPLLQENGLVLLLDETIKADAVGSFVESTATLIDIATGDSVSTHSMAREDVGTKFMSPGQATGAAVSYARKYALGGMFAIDNEEDIDSQAYQQKRSQTPQNRPQQPANIDRGSNNNEMKNKALKALKEAMTQYGTSKEEMQAIAGWKFGKTSTAEMTLGEISDLANNLGMYIQQATGRTG